MVQSSSASYVTNVDNEEECEGDGRLAVEGGGNGWIIRSKVFDIELALSSSPQPSASAVNRTFLNWSSARTLSSLICDIKMICRTNFYCLLLFLYLQLLQATPLQKPIRGTQCALNQVITRLTFYEDGAIEAECNKLPCGNTGTNCIESQASCRAETDVVSGMKWASNGQSVLLRCCHLSAPTRLYVGTDRVTLGSYYTGGLVDEKDLYGKDGDTEYDFISNLRTEQGAVRIWVYRVMCSKNSSHLVYEEHGKITDGRAFAFEKRRQYLLKQLDGQTDNIKKSEMESTDDAIVPSSSPRPFNPLRYTPASYRPHHKSMDTSNPVERLL